MDFASAREAMVEHQLRRRGISGEHILAAFRAVPREAFVATGEAQFAYEDRPLPIAAGQTISQPYIVALMIQAAGIGPGDRVLEVGAGSGYAAAIMAQIGTQVVAIERHPNLARDARDRLARLGFGNVEIVEGDGTLGRAEGAPYDAIPAAASGSHVPPAWIAQLKVGGRIVMPIGASGGKQTLIRGVLQADRTLKQHDLGAVRFVPLIGEEGWNA